LIDSNERNGIVISVSSRSKRKSAMWSITFIGCLICGHTYRSNGGTAVASLLEYVVRLAIAI
jgi:hypothetical protein